MEADTCDPYTPDEDGELTEQHETPMDVHVRARANLFPGALAHVADWEPGRLDPRSYVAWSSQALCVSVWGSIAESEARRAILADVFATAGVELELDAQPKIECEVRGRRDVLNEHGGSNPTCPDVLITWPRAVVAIESKFTEHLSGCSQAKSQQVKTPERGKLMRLPACSGNYEVGSDLRTMTDAPCRLTVNERNRTARRYWDVAARLFQPEALRLPKLPCPFRAGNYQLMRNICFAAALAELETRPTSGFLLAYVKAARTGPESERVFAEFKAMLSNDVAQRTGAISYETIARIVRGHAQCDLADWVEDRLQPRIAAR